MSGNFAQEKILRNKVNRAATKLRYEFYHKHEGHKVSRLEEKHE